MIEKIDLAEYLFRRLAQLGCGSIHGVPGDSNLAALDYIEPAGIHWVGNANELNAGYAADGYARIKGIGALITSFGVGELSAVNAIAGAYAEKVPVVHIVGTPATATQSAEMHPHHTLGNGNSLVFSEIHRQITVAQAKLDDTETAPVLIDAVIRECVLRSRPVYIQLPTNMVKAKVDAPSVPINPNISGYEEGSEEAVVDSLIERIQAAEQVLLLVDGFSARFNIRDEINRLAKSTGFPTMTTPFGKGLIDEKLPNYCGTYSGMVGDRLHQAWVKDCDLVVHLTPLKSDLNTFFFTAIPDPNAAVVIEQYSVQIGNNAPSSRPISIKSLLRKLLKRLETVELAKTAPFPRNETPRTVRNGLLPAIPDSLIDQDSFWQRTSGFLVPGDIVLTGTGTSGYGALGLYLPENITVINSFIWASTGHALGASQGVALAKREMRDNSKRSSGRTVVIEGDGSLQMSAQAISDIIWNKLDVVIFIMNNKGYTVERAIHDPNARYHDIQPWRNLEAPSYFGAPKDDPEYPVTTRQVHTLGELESVFADPQVKKGDGLTMVEVMLDYTDLPGCLRETVSFVLNKRGGQVV